MLILCKTSRLLGQNTGWKILLGVLLILYAWAPSNLLPFAPQWFGFPKLDLSHGDSRVILSAAREFAGGGDPLITNPTDPWNRPFNYPRIVGLLAMFLDFGPEHARFLGTAFGFLFAVGVLAQSRSFTNLGLAVYVAFIVSPPVMFGIERGNLDVFVFGLLALACSSMPRTLPIFIPMLCALKLYPVFAIPPATIIAKGNLRTMWIASGVVCLLYALLIFDDLSLIRAATPDWPYFSYGIRTLGLRTGRPSLFTAMLIAAVLTFALGLLPGRRSNIEMEASEGIRWSALSGAAIFTGSFFLGTNFNYRLVFLLLVIPFLLAEAFHPKVRRIRLVSGFCIVLLLLTFWADRLFTGHTGPFRVLWLLDEAAPLLALATCGWVIGRVTNVKTSPTSP